MNISVFTDIWNCVRLPRRYLLELGVVMGFIMRETDAVTGASAMTAGLAGEASGHGASAAAAGAVVPPGIEEISAANAAKIAAYTAEVAAMVEASAANHAAYGVATGTSAAITTLTDALSAAGLADVI